jgi:hypothetical protein
MDHDIAERKDVFQSSRANLSWLSIVYILCISPLYLIWNLVPLQRWGDVQRWGDLLIFVSIPSNIVLFVVNVIVVLSISLWQRRIKNQPHPEQYSYFNFRILGWALLTILVITLCYQLWHLPVFSPDDAKLRPISLLFMLLPIIPLGTVLLRFRKAD